MNNDLKTPSVRTDLAVEAHETLKNEQLPIGLDIENSGTDAIKITRVKVTTAEAEKTIGKPIGNYITLEIPGLKENNQSLFEESCKKFAEELAKVLKLEEHSTILIVGLGNWNITPDALGPRTISKLMVTRHLINYVPKEVQNGVRPVCAFAPGVLGITGMETLEIVKGIVERVNPNLVIAIDALASRKLDRVSTTVQIADTGISPGSGVGNKRMELSFNTLGVPVIAIGIPTVVDAATMASDTIDLVIESMIKLTSNGSDFYNMLKNLERDDKYQLIREVLKPNVGDLIVTPKEIDDIIERVSNFIANGINLALHKGITLKDMNKYLH